jgi:hypothetical protein
LAKERFGSGDNDAVSRLVKENPQLKHQIEQAFAERLIYGDWDNHAGNFVIVETANGPKIQSIDLDHAFSAKKKPEWIAGDSTALVNARLHADFSGQQLSADTVSKIKSFLQEFDTAAGRQQLRKLGLEPKEIDGLLSRAKYLADRGRFPEAKGAKKVLEDAGERARKLAKKK